MGTSKHKQELLSLIFYCYLSIPAIFARLYKVSQEERTCKLARGFKNQDQELYPGKSRVQRKARPAGQMVWILQAPKGSKRNQSHVLRRMKDHAEVQGAWRTMAQNSSGCAVHVDTLQLSIVGVLCSEPPFRAEVFIFPRVLGVLAAVTPDWVPV